MLAKLSALTQKNLVKISYIVSCLCMFYGSSFCFFSSLTVSPSFDLGPAPKSGLGIVTDSIHFDLDLVSTSGKAVLNTT